MEENPALPRLDLREHLSKLRRRSSRALSSLDLNILSAKVQTLGADVVDSFYVLDNEGKKIVDQAHAEEIREAVRHAIEISTVMQRNSNER